MDGKPDQDGYRTTGPAHAAVTADGASAASGQRRAALIVAGVSPWSGRRDVVRSLRTRTSIDSWLAERRRRWMLESRDFPETRPSLLAELGKEGAGQSAWREFFERYAPAVFRVARMHRLDRHDADDIVQQVMVQVAGHIADFEYDRDRGRFRNWVRRIAEHKIMDFMRRRSLPVELDARPDQSPDDRADREAAWEEAWAHQDLEWCLDQVALDLAPRRMEAFRLYVLEGVSAAETAQRMDMTVGHVYVIRAQVINKLRKVMARLGGG